MRIAHAILATAILWVGTSIAEEPAPEAAQELEELRQIKTIRAMPVERLGEHSEELRSRTWTRDEAVDARNARLGEFGEIRLPDMSERHHHGPET